MRQIQFSLIKKNKDVQNTRYPPTLLRPVASHFCLTHPPVPHPLKVDVMCVSLLKCGKKGSIYFSFVEKEEANLDLKVISIVV